MKFSTIFPQSRKRLLCNMLFFGDVLVVFYSFVGKYKYLVVYSQSLADRN